MSDMFDDIEVYRLQAEYNYYGGDGEDGPSGRQRMPSKKDPLYYFSLIEFLEIKAETEKSYLIFFCVYKGKEFTVWVPKRIIKNLDLENKTGYFHITIFKQILEKWKKENL